MYVQKKKVMMTTPMDKTRETDNSPLTTIVVLLLGHVSVRVLFVDSIVLPLLQSA